MRTFYAILLLGVVTYVQAVHECARYAVFAEESPAAVNAENTFSVEDFLSKQINTFYTVKSVQDVPSNACIGPAHGANCGGVVYSRKFVENHNTFDKDLLLKALEMDVYFVALNISNNTAMEYKMRISGTYEHNYIFKHVPNTNIEVFEIYDITEPHIHRLQVEDPDKYVLDILKMEFALFRFIPQSYYIYVTCNLQFAWVTYDEGTDFDENDPNLEEDIRILMTLAQSEGKFLFLGIINRTFHETLFDYVSKIFIPRE